MALVRKTNAFQIRPFQRYTYNGTLQHPRFVVEQLNILAVSQIHAKNFEESESMLKKALKICEFHTNDTQNPWKPSLLVWTLHSFAQLEQHKNNLAEALKYVLQMNEVNSKAFESKLIPHKALVVGIAKAGQLHYDLGNHEEAEKEFQRIIELDKATENCSKEKICKTSALALLYLGKIELARENFEKARVILERSWEIYRHVTGILNVHIYTVLFELGKAYQGVGDFARARTLLEYAGQGYESFLYDQEKAETVAEVWKEVISHLPGVDSVRQVGPDSGRHGIAQYTLSENPEEDKRRKEKAEQKKSLLTKWKKTHNIKKFESNE